MKHFILILICLSFILLFGCSDMADLTVEIPKIGAADCIVIQCGTAAVMIDAGEEDDSEEITALLAKNGITSLDYLILTHYDKDHIGGAPAVLKAVSVEKVLLPRYEKDSERYQLLMETIKSGSINHTFLDSDQTFTLGELKFEVSIPKRDSYESNDNEHSLVTRLTYGNKSFLFAGDAEAERLSELIEVGNLACDVLKMPHHGRYSDSTEAFLAACKPDYAVVTDSDKSPADPSVLGLFTKDTIEYFETRNGNIRITTDGRHLALHQDG